MDDLGRRGLLLGVAATLVAAAATSARAQIGMTRERTIPVQGARLLVRDTGGPGEAVVLAHPGTGSAYVWDNQVPVFAAAGYRVIAWSRRGFRGTSVEEGAVDPGTTADIDALADALGLTRFHALGSAAGGGTMLDYAVARGERLLSLVVADSIGNMADADYRRRSSALRPAPFEQLPPDVRELGPSYRAADPGGVARWLALEKTARALAAAPPGPPPPGVTLWSDIAALRMPVLWLTGGADLYTPPPLLAEFHRRLPGSDMTVIADAGHSAYWERPAEFNRAVLAFLRRHRAGRTRSA